MSGVQGTQQTSRVQLTAPSATGSSQPTSAPVLMPEPQPLSDTGGDPMAVLYELLSKQRNADMESGAAGIKHNRELQKSEQLKEEADFKKQEDAKRSAEAWGIFGKIASIIAIAVSAVASVCSCGAASALCAAACILSAAAFVEGEAHIVTKLTGDPKAEAYFQLGCGLAAAACSGGAGIANLGANALAAGAQIAGASATIAQDSISLWQDASGNNDQGWKDVALGLGISAAAASLGGGLASATGLGESAAQAAKSAADDTEDIVNAATEMGQAAAEAMQGASSIGKGFCEADAVDALADAKQTQMQIAHLQQLVEWAIDGVKETDESHARALSTLQGAIQTKGQTLVMASSMRV